MDKSRTNSRDNLDEVTRAYSIHTTKRTIQRRREIYLNDLGGGCSTQVGLHALHIRTEPIKEIPDRPLGDEESSAVDPTHHTRQLRRSGG